MNKPFRFLEADANEQQGGLTGFALESQILEAQQDNTELKFKVRVIRAGASKNNRFYSDKVLREATPLLENVKVYAKTDRDHLNGQRGAFAGLMGNLTKPVFIEGQRPNTGEIQAVLEALSKDALAQKLYEATAKGWTDAFGFSIDADGQVRNMGNGLIEAVAITKFNSLDLITSPGADGRVIAFLEGAPEEPKSDTFFFSETPPQNTPPATPPAQNSGQFDMAQFMEAQQQQTQAAIREAEMRWMKQQAETQVNAVDLPDLAKQQIIESLGNRSTFTPNDVQRLIEGYQGMVNPDAGKVQNTGGWGDNRIIETSYEKGKQWFADLFDDEKTGSWSIKEAYTHMTGDYDFMGQVAANAPLREAEGFTLSTFANDVLGDGIRRAALREYNNQLNLFSWRPLVDIVPFQDFRVKQNTRWGGYGDLADVGEGEAYPAMTSPTGEMVEYGISKKGGTENVTMEMIANDDMGVIRKIPTKLGRSAARTLSKYVFSFLSTNPIIYDGTALFTSDHNNLSALPLNEDNFYELYLKMMEQTEYGSEEHLAIPPSYLIVPLRLEKTARDIFKRDTNLDSTHVQNINIQIIVSWAFTDLNNWYLSARPSDIPTIELGFFRNKQQPEFFVQDNPTSGSMYTNDKITYKIRHIYGGAIQDYRGLQASIVA